MVGIVLTLVVIGVLMWLLNTYIPMDPTFKRIINIVVVVAVVLWLLQVFGVFSLMSNVPPPHFGR